MQQASQRYFYSQENCNSNPAVFIKCIHAYALKDSSSANLPELTKLKYRLRVISSPRIIVPARSFK